jgi:DCN1-like protein 1/2
LARLIPVSFAESTDEEDKTGVNGTMRYLQDLGLNLESAEILVPLEIVQAPALAEMSKEGFVEGWKTVGCVSPHVEFGLLLTQYLSADTIPKQKSYVAGQLKQLSTDMALFKKVYRHTFVCSREQGQKALPLENALVYWEMIFNSPGKPWITGTPPIATNWTNLWIEFLRANWTKTVNKDMWNQTFEFFQKTMQDETLSFWSEDGAWPGVIDEFVAYVKEKRGDLPDTMETD